MPRGDHKIEGTPYRIWLVEIDPHNRVRLPLTEVRVLVPWLKSESGSVDCVGTPGPAGGVQIEPFAAHETLGRSYTEALGATAAQSSEAGQKWVDMARLLATSWRITISIETGRINITLPEPMRRAQLIPPAGGLAVVFGFGEILEVWDAVKWHDHVRAVAKMKLSAFSQAVEDLRDR
jgi:DNA-binding transcriptional regulator/RsmH inhibitor MraZ